jgi:tetratricopeptide (TPR) repeat protein
MTRLLSPGRSLVFGFLLTAMMLAAQQPLNWDARISDGIAALKAGHAGEAVELLLPLSEQAKTFSADDVRRVELTLALAAAYQYHGQLDNAEPLYLDAIQWLEAHRKSASMLAIAYDNLGRLRLEQGRSGEAEELLGKARNLYIKTRNPQDPRIANVDRVLGEAYLSQGRITEAMALLENAVDMLRQAPDVAATTLAAALRGLATGYAVQGRYHEAEVLLQESIRLNHEDGRTSLELADGVLALGHVFLLLRDTARALPLIEKAVRVFELSNDPRLPSALSELGAAALQDGKYGMAREYLSRALDIDQKLFGWDHVGIALVQGGLAEAYYGERNYDQAAALIQQAIISNRASMGESHFTLARLLLVEATIEAKQRRASEADAHYRQALDICRKTFAADHPDVVKAQREYAQFTKNLRK